MGRETFYVTLSGFDVPELSSGLEFSHGMWFPPFVGCNSVSLGGCPSGIEGYAAFYGPNHEEVAGTFQYAQYRAESWLPVQNTTSGHDRQTGFVAVGAFGAKRQ